MITDMIIWMKEAIKKYYDKGDLVVLISSSGNSKPCSSWKFL